MRIVFICISIMFLFLSCSNETHTTPSGKKVFVGVLAPMHNKHKHYGLQGFEGLKLAKKLKPYLSNGDEIVFDVIDTTKTDITKALKDFKSKKVKLIISFEGSDEILKSKEAFQNYPITILAAFATNSQITAISHNISQICMDNKTQAMVAAHFIKDEKLMRDVVVFYEEDNLYSKELSKKFIKYFEEIGGIILANIDVSRDENLELFKPLLKQNIDFVFNVTNASTTIKILNMLKKHHLDTQVLSSDGTIGNVLQEHKKEIDMLDGMYVIENYTHIKNKKQKLFSSLLKKQDIQNSDYAFLAYDTYALVYDVLDLCKKYNTKCIQKLLRDSYVIEGISGNFSIVNAKAKREVYVNRIDDLKLVREIVTY